MSTARPGSTLPAHASAPSSAVSSAHSSLHSSGATSASGLLRVRRGRHARPGSSRRVAAVGVTATLLPVTVATATASPAQAASKVSTRLYSSAPASIGAGRVALVGGRLLTVSGRPVRGAVLEVQRPSGRGWKTFTTARTNANGTGKAAVRLTATKRVRVFFRGSATHHFTTSGVRVVTVRRSKAAARSTVGRSGSFGARVVAEARRHRGKPYRWGATGPNSFDCSGFTRYVYARNGVRLPRTSREQQRATARVPASQKRVGDLVFTWTRGRVTHVGIYAGGNRMWAAPRTGDVVKLQSIYSRNISVGRAR